jgi:predicted PhzF superfamily epimerase YddE/YHI9
MWSAMRASHSREQGTRMRRRRILHVQINGAGNADGIEVGGRVAPIVEATMSF